MIASMQTLPIPINRPVGHAWTKRLAERPLPKDEYFVTVTAISDATIDVSSELPENFTSSCLEHYVPLTDVPEAMPLTDYLFQAGGLIGDPNMANLIPEALLSPIETEGVDYEFPGDDARTTKQVARIAVTVSDNLRVSAESQRGAALAAPSGAYLTWLLYLGDAENERE